MWIFYACALIPIVIGLILMMLDKRIVWQEWLIGSGACFLVAGIFNIIAVCNIHSKTDDIETWSGQISVAHHYAAWKEYYEYAVYRTEYYTVSVSNSNGKGSHTEQRSRQVFDHWEPTTRWHHDSYDEQSNINTDYDTDAGRYGYIVNKFGKQHVYPGNRTTGEHNSHMIQGEGDPNDYQSDNINSWIEPVTKIMHFENRVRATPNLFSYTKVPTNIMVWPWPENPDYNHSQRLMGNALALIDPLKFDQLNSKLGASKKVNLIMIGFGDKGQEYGHYQESKFYGGKKNDLVITFSSTNGEAANWCYVFGWAKDNLVKHNIESILLSNKINNDILPLLESEIRKNYTIRDWNEFDYLTVEPSTWIYITYFILMLLIQSSLYLYFHFNNNEIWNKSKFRY